MTDASSDRAQLEFVLAPDTSGILVERRDAYDLHSRNPEAPLPVVAFVHGPVRAGEVRPRDWRLYRGYAALAANAGLAAAVVDLDYTDVEALEVPTAQLAAALDELRSEDSVDPERGVIWAFSGGGRLVGAWLEQPPSWLRAVALTYPVAPEVTSVAAPLVVTRVGREQDWIQQRLDRFLKLVPDAELIEVVDGQHGFDGLDHDDDSRRAVEAAMSSVARRLGATPS